MINDLRDYIQKVEKVDDLKLIAGVTPIEPETLAAWLRTACIPWATSSSMNYGDVFNVKL